MWANVRDADRVQYGLPALGRFDGPSSVSENPRSGVVSNPLRLCLKENDQLGIYG